MTGHDLVQFFKTHFPEDKAYDWDHVGLQIGHLNQKLTGIMIALDVTESTLQDTIDQGCNVLITHHPFLFHPLKKIHLDTPKGQLIETIIKHDILVYAAHTNYDVAGGGMNDVLADLLGLKDKEVLDVDDDGTGIGRVGLIEPTALDDFIQTVKKTLQLSHVHLISHQDDKVIKKVAISGGAGSHHLFAAKKKGADIYLTGDITYHTALEALELKQRVLDIGHFAESQFKTAFKDTLLKAGFDVKVSMAQEVSPFKLK